MVSGGFSRPLQVAATGATKQVELAGWCRTASRQGQERTASADKHGLRRRVAQAPSNAWQRPHALRSPGQAPSETARGIRGSSRHGDRAMTAARRA